MKVQHSNIRLSNKSDRRLLAFIGAFILVIGHSFSQQNVSQDIRNINLAVFDAKNLQMELSYQLFFDDVINSEMKGLVKKSGNMVNQQVGSITIIKKEPYCLFMDSDRKL